MVEIEHRFKKVQFILLWIAALASLIHVGPFNCLCTESEIEYSVSPRMTFLIRRSMNGRPRGDRFGFTLARLVTASKKRPRRETNKTGGS